MNILRALRQQGNILDLCLPPMQSLPHSLGEGVNSALEDAAVLGAAVSAVGGDPAAAAAEFNDRRRAEVHSNLCLGFCLV